MCLVIYSLSKNDTLQTLRSAPVLGLDAAASGVRAFVSEQSHYNSTTPPKLCRVHANGLPAAQEDCAASAENCA